MTVILWIILLSLPVAFSLECYTGSQLTVQQCPSVNCVKHVFGMDTVRYCDGSGAQSVCQAYKVFDTCDMVPNVGFICCCSGNLCNPASSLSSSILILLLPLVLRFI